MNILLLFLLGATLGTVCDSFHVYSGTTAYPSPYFYRLAWWVPILFGTAAVQMGYLHTLADRLLKRPTRKYSRREIVGCLLVFVGVYFLSAFWKTHTLWKTATLFVVWISLWITVDRTWHGVVQALITALFGCAFEATIIRFGMFSYLEPDFLGITYWLIILYATASIAIGNLGRVVFSKPLA